MALPSLESILLPDGRTLEAVKEHWVDRQQVAENAQRGYWTHWERLYSQYRAYKEIRDGYGVENDRDDRLAEAKRLFGTAMSLPYAFATVESILPRAVSQRPRMMVLPDGDASAKNVENMKRLIDRQQEQIAYELLLQDTAKSGFIFGLGWQKTGWRKKTVQTKELALNTTGDGWIAQDAEKVKFDDPYAWNCWLFDMFWDPVATTVEGCRYLIHRTWKDGAYVMEALARGQDPSDPGGWVNPAGLMPEDVQSLGGNDARWSERLQPLLGMTGQGEMNLPQDGAMHEVWECHDCRGDIVTILDRQMPVHVTKNPFWHGEFPFQAFRPTTQAIPQIPGIGEVEPTAELVDEMNTLRANRRDNAALKLMQVFAIHGGFVDKDDLEFFPGAFLEVPGDPREMLMQINVGDIPNSSYNEEAALRGDIEHASGLSDEMLGMGAQGQTATGVQLVQAAAGIRIQLKSRRVEVELCAPAARQWVSMNQQFVIERPFAIPAEPTALDPSKRWLTKTLTPAELAGNFIIVEDGGAIQPESEQEKQVRAQQLLAFRGDPNIDQRRLYVEVLELYGIKNPVGWLVPIQHVPPILLDILVGDYGVPQELINEALEMAFQFEQAQLEGEHEPPAKPDMEASSNGGTRREIERDDQGRASALVTREG